jgi:hypothetical protein
MRRLWLSRLAGWALFALMLVGMGMGPGALVYASSVPGSPVTIAGLNDLTATADDQATAGAGKIFGMALGLGGLGLVCAGKIGLGASGVGAGLAAGFIPGMVSSAFDAAPAATGSEVLMQLSESLQMLAGFVGYRSMQDPVFWGCLAMTLLALHLRPRSSAVAH